MSGVTDRIDAIAIVDGHPLIADAVRVMVEHETDLQLVWGTYSPAQARTLLESSSPDLLIMELLYPGDSGFDLLRFATEHYPRLPVLIYSTVDENSAAERSLRLGAKGYLMKSCGASMLLAAIRRLLGGGIHLSPAMSDRLLGTLHPGQSSKLVGLEQLSSREAEVFQLIGRGLSCAQIAVSMNRSRKTIETFQLRIRRKLGLEGIRELAQYSTVQWIEERPRTIDPK